MLTTFFWNGGLWSLLPLPYTRNDATRVGAGSVTCWKPNVHCKWQHPQLGEELFCSSLQTLRSFLFLFYENQLTVRNPLCMYLFVCLFMLAFGELRSKMKKELKKSCHSNFCVLASFCLWDQRSRCYIVVVEKTKLWYFLYYLLSGTNSQISRNLEYVSRDTDWETKDI